MEFALAVKEEFEGFSKPATFFTSGERLILLNDIVSTDAVLREAMTGKPVKGGGGWWVEDPSQTKTKKKSSPPLVISALHPVHDIRERQELLNTWVYAFSKPQPLEKIRAYFGEEIGFYFGFIGVYTQWLTLPAGLGVYVYYVQHFHGFDNLTTVSYAGFLAVWATIFLEYWKRKEFRHAFDWDVHDFEEHEEDRQEFKEAAELVYDEVAQAERYVYPSSKRMLAYATSLLWCGFSMALASSSMIYFLTWTDYAAIHWVGEDWQGAWQFAKFAPTVAYSLLISVFSSLNKLMAAKLTRWEMHRTESEMKNAIVLKLVTLQFVNFYVALFYTAFISRDLAKLQKRLATLLIVQQVVGNFLEVGLPTFKQSMGFMKEAKEEDEGAKGQSGRVIRELSLEEYSGVFDDYLELWVQFGQVTLFAVSFPLAGLFALLNNVIEIRSDAFKLTKATAR